MRKGFWQSFNEGYGATKRVGDDIEAFLDKKGLADAYAQGDIKNTNTGTDAAVEYGNAAQGLDQASFDSPEQYAAAEKAYTDAASQALQQGQGYAIGDKQFTNRAEAEAAQPGLRNAAVAAYYGGKGEVGKQMEYEKEARSAKLQGMQMEGAEMELDQKKKMKDAYDTYQKDLESAKGDFWNVAKKRFNGNNGHLGEGAYKDATIDFKETPEGAIVWAKDAKGNLLGQAQHVTRQQVENDIIHSYFVKTDPSKAAEMKRHEKERGEDVDHRTKTLEQGDRHHKDDVGLKKQGLSLQGGQLNLQLQQLKHTLSKDAEDRQIRRDANGIAVAEKAEKHYGDAINSLSEAKGDKSKEWKGELTRATSALDSNPEFKKLKLSNPTQAASLAEVNATLNSVVNDANKGLFGIQALGGKASASAAVPRNWVYEPDRKVFTDTVTKQSISESKLGDLPYDIKALMVSEPGARAVLDAQAKDAARKSAESAAADASRPKQTLGDNWYSHDNPTDVANEEGTPNIMANGLNGAVNFFKRSARQARAE